MKSVIELEFELETLDASYLWMKVLDEDGDRDKLNGSNDGMNKWE